jgi:hypothetical protein
MRPNRGPKKMQNITVSVMRSVNVNVKKKMLSVRNKMRKMSVVESVNVKLG